jgi:hypothetical protein
MAHIDENSHILPVSWETMETLRKAGKSLVVLPGGSLGVSSQESAETAQDCKGLSMYHISPRSGDKASRPEVTLWRGAGLITAELGKVQAKQKPNQEWVRGEISSFSKQSRRRILRLIATIKHTLISSFVTLTYPDHFEQDPRKVKKHLDNFFKRLIREFPEIVVIWRLEAKQRKSGLNAGKIAPHFHLLIWNVEYKRLLAWIPANWYQVVGSNDEKHLKAGTSVEPVRSSNGVMYYTAKYICKADNLKLFGWGRYWGVVNRETLSTIQGERVNIKIDDATAKTILRYMRHKASEVYKSVKRKGQRREHVLVGHRKFPKWGYKFTLIGNADFWERAIIQTSNQNELHEIGKISHSSKPKSGMS